MWNNVRLWQGVSYLLEYVFLCAHTLKRFSTLTFLPVNEQFIFKCLHTTKGQRGYRASSGLVTRFSHARHHAVGGPDTSTP